MEAQVEAAEDAVWLRMPDRRVEPRARWWWTIRAAIRVAIIVAGMAAAYLWVEPLRPWLGLPIQIATVLGLIYIAAMPPGGMRFTVGRRPTRRSTHGLVGMCGSGEWHRSRAFRRSTQTRGRSSN